MPPDPSLSLYNRILELQRTFKHALYEERQGSVIASFLPFYAVVDPAERPRKGQSVWVRVHGKLRAMTVLRANRGTAWLEDKTAAHPITRAYGELLINTSIRAAAGKRLRARVL
jgi:hypothetical protein